MPEQTFDGIDAGRPIDWGKTSEDYDRYRPGPPDSFYEKLIALGIGHSGQQILDLGTGTGVLARRFAMRGARVNGIDISQEQIELAKHVSARVKQYVYFQVAAAEDIPFSDHSFDVVTANQCWLYFDLKRVVPEVCRILKPGGKLLISHFSFMPHLDELVRASEGIVLKYNPDWSGANWYGYITPEPTWSKNIFDLVGLFVYDEQIPFSRESWRGRMRALRGIAASLGDDEVAAFDEEHRQMLEARAPDEFDLWHRIHAHIYQPVDGIRYNQSKVNQPKS